MINALKEEDMYEGYDFKTMFESGDDEAVIEYIDHYYINILGPKIEQLAADKKALVDTAARRRLDDYEYQRDEVKDNHQLLGS